MNERRLLDSFRKLAPPVDFWSLRLVEEDSEVLCMRQHRLQAPQLRRNLGVHLTFARGGGMAWSATCDLSEGGLRRACERAIGWLEASRRHGLFSAELLPRPTRSGSYESPVRRPWHECPPGDKIALLAEANKGLGGHEGVVDWQAWLDARRRRVWLATSDGIEIDQHFHYLAPGLAATANRGGETQIRTGGGAGAVVMAGLEGLEHFGFRQAPERVAAEALALLDAPECPATSTDLLLMPNQMMLQLHESLGHPLELDRILGDERNLAGESFVSPDMFGSFRYGSELLNVTFDPTVPGEVASYAFDDHGSPARREYLIRGGILLRGLGGALSQARSGLPGVATTRAGDWNRPAIDRMGNINLEPGESSLKELIAQVERGVLMDTNRSWSIDDRRNKFQFSCELGRLIEDGELKGLVRNPNYRGLSRHFWRNLAGVGDAASREVWGTYNCGKGEPNQLMLVGHAAPPCLFREVEVFGGE